MRGKVMVCLLLSVLLALLAWSPVSMAQEGSETPTAASDEEPNDYTLWEMIQDSFPIGIVIIIVSVATVALAVEHFVTLQRDKLIPPDLLQDIEELFEDENYEDIMETCAAEPGFLTNVIGAALPRVKTGYDSMMEAVQAVAEEESVKLQQKISWLQLFGAIGPMLGLLGTVWGMINAFNTIANLPGAPKPKDLAGGIREALVTTVMGLIVALIAIPCYFYFRNKVVRISMEISGVAEELLDRFRERG